MINIYDKAYLGDAVYASFDGYNIILETSNGLRATNTIYLDPMVFSELVKHVETIRTGLAGEIKEC